MDSCMKLVIFLLFDNLFIYQVLCTLIHRRRSLYSFLFNHSSLEDYDLKYFSSINIVLHFQRVRYDNIQIQISHKFHIVEKYN